ncbi:hypothetical protein NQ317_006507 [Molorchus minor]|uniref:CCHC-type domain-containing protein n=1 Tax=Molorchus minor TaxID=1323400 RepID=A0ABQ9J717_9CUCU|nr:hypothetical protein NQ317_006507 [Molorchus minor]
MFQKLQKGYSILKFLISISQLGLHRTVISATRRLEQPVPLPVRQTTKGTLDFEVGLRNQSYSRVVGPKGSATKLTSFIAILLFKRRRDADVEGAVVSSCDGTKISRDKLDPNRLLKDELIYELRVRGLGDGSDLAVAELRTILRNALKLEKTTLAIKSPAYPYTFAQDSAALTENLGGIEKQIDEFSGTEGDSKFKGILSKIAHCLGRINRASPQNDVEKSTKEEIRRKLLLYCEKLGDKAKSSRRVRDSTVFDLSVLRHVHESPDAHSSAVESDSDSDNDNATIKIKPVPVRDWGLKFTGRKGQMSFSTFIERVEEMRKSRGLSRALLFRDAGDAYVWYNMVKDWATDWDSLIELMREQFQSEHFDRDLFEEIKRRSQGPNENIGLYIASMKGLFSKLKQPVSDETQLEIILERVDPYYQPFLAFEKIISITQLLSACRKLDLKREIAKSYTPPPAKNKSLIPELAYASTSSGLESVGTRRDIATTSRDSSSSDTRRPENSGSISSRSCWNCGGTDHISTRCSRPQKPHVNGDERPYVTVSIFGKRLLGLLDSGASRTIVGNKGWQILKDIGLVRLEKCNLTSVTVANGNMCECIGVLRTPVKLQDVEKIIDILVVPDLSHTLILGIDFWSRMGIVPNISSNEWTFALAETIDIDSVESLKPRSSLTREESAILDKLVDDTFASMGDHLDRTEAFNKLYADVKSRLIKAAEKNRHYYNLRHRDIRYELGARVYRKNFVLSDAAKHFSSKLAPKFVGPYIVSKKLSTWTYELKDLDGRFRGVWHAKDLKPSPD